MRFPYTLFVEVIVCIVYLFYAKKETRKFNLIKWLLVITVLFETTGVIVFNVFHQKNQWLYNLYLPVEMIFSGLIIKECSKPYLNTGGWLPALLILLLVSYGTEIGYNGFFQYCYLTNSLFSVFVVTACCIYYHRLLNDDSHKAPDLLTYSRFWILTGMFIFCFGSTACNLFFKHLASASTTQLKSFRYILLLFLNTINYGLWAYALLCQKKTPISISLS
jgi:hypothetical protein